MGSAYALSTFLRQTPKSLLQRYFVANGLLEEVPFDELRPRDTATVTEALNRLEPVVRARVDLDFQDVHALADKFATRIVMDVANAYEPELVDELGAMENHYARAMWLFLERRRHDDDLFEQCRDLVQVEQIRFSRSKRRNNLPHEEPAVDEPVLMLLADGVKELYQAQGRGRNCQVEVFERTEPRRYFFVGYPRTTRRATSSTTRAASSAAGPGAPRSRSPGCSAPTRASSRSTPPVGETRSRRCSACSWRRRSGGRAPPPTATIAASSSGACSTLRSPSSSTRSTTWSASRSARCGWCGLRARSRG